MRWEIRAPMALSCRLNSSFRMPLRSRDPFRLCWTRAQSWATSHAQRGRKCRKKYQKKRSIKDYERLVAREKVLNLSERRPHSIARLAKSIVVTQLGDIPFVHRLQCHFVSGKFSKCFPSEIFPQSPPKTFSFWPSRFVQVDLHLAFRKLLWQNCPEICVFLGKFPGESCDCGCDGKYGVVGDAVENGHLTRPFGQVRVRWMDRERVCSVRRMAPSHSGLNGEAGFTSCRLFSPSTPSTRPAEAEGMTESTPCLDFLCRKSGCDVTPGRFVWNPGQRVKGARRFPTSKWESFLSHALPSPRFFRPVEFHRGGAFWLLRHSEFRPDWRERKEIRRIPNSFQLLCRRH